MGSKVGGEVIEATGYTRERDTNGPITATTIPIGHIRPKLAVERTIS